MRARVLAMLLVAVAAACGDVPSGMPEVSDARIGQPTGANGAFYMTARGYDAADRLVAVSTVVAPSAELHETVIGSDGTATMRSVDSMDLPRSGRLVLEPGGLHVMLIDVDRLEVGATVSVSLVWENAGEMTIEAVVVEASDTMGGVDHG
jgi:periplasmic copper chaperone A